MEIISIYIFDIDKKSTYREKSIWRYFFNNNTGNIGRLKYREKSIYRNTDGAYVTPFSRKSGIPLRRCTTFYTRSSDQKWLKNVILCTKSMQMEFSHLIHKDMIIFTFIG